MSDLFNEFLNTAATPEYSEQLITGYKTLENVGIDDHIAEIDQLISAHGDNRDDTLQWIDQIIRMSLVNAIGQFGVTVKDDIKMNKIVLTALAQDLDDYEDIDRLDVILGMDLDPTDMLIELLESVTPYHAEEFLPHIDNVSPHLINRLEDIVAAKIEAPSMDVLVVQNTVRRFNLWKRLHKTEDDLLVYQYLLQGGRFTTPMSELVAANFDALKTINNHSTLGDQLLGFALASDLADAEIPKEMNSYLEQLGVSPFDMAAAMKATTTYFHLLGEAASNEQT